MAFNQLGLGLKNEKMDPPNSTLRSQSAPQIKSAARKMDSRTVLKIVLVWSSLWPGLWPAYQLCGRRMDRRISL